MIKVRFQTDSLKDACLLIEDYLAVGLGVDDWLEIQVPNLSFDSMDYPFDMVDCYDCYFQCKDDITDSQNVNTILSQSLQGCADLQFEIYIVDDKLNVISRL